MKKEKQNCARIDWVDSNGYGAWHKRDEEENKPSKIITIGMIEEESKEAITIKQSHDFTLDRLGCTITIPKCAIKSLERFKK